MRRIFSFVFHLPRRVLITLVKAYRLLLSPSLGSACRFAPTCSAYSLQALEQYGALYGSYLTMHRVARCQPWCEGGWDPVPTPPERQPGKPSFFTRLVTPVTSSPSKKTSS